jgi:ABC-type antimicrobial peptide transport system permease subunit
MRRSLIHYWRPHLAVVLGAAVTTAVLTGALVVGDSLRGSLRDLTLDRLGTIDWALVGERPFRPSLAADIGAALGGKAPARLLTLRAAATAAESGSRASQVALWGVDDDFFALFPRATPIDLAARQGPFASAAVNQALATELGVAEGAQLVLSFAPPSDVPRETVVGRADNADTVEVLRVTLSHILPDRGPGGFGLEPRQARALNVFVDRARLERAVLGRDGEGVNLLLAGSGGPGSEQLTAALPDLLRLGDLGLDLRGAGAVATLESRQFVLDDRRAAVAEGLARELGGAVQPVLTYLANSIAVGDRSVPYSTVTALDPPAAPALGPFVLIDGRPAPALGEDEILLNQWAADDLGAVVGDAVALTYYTLGPRDRLETRRHSLTLAGVVAMEGLALAPHLTPEFPGIEGADDIAAWDPPFPVALDAIRPQDEAYWDRYRSAPKAFVSPTLGRQLWQSRFGSLTSLRLAFADRATLQVFGDELTRRLDLPSAGLLVRPLRAEGLRAARGATDFAGLFLGLSLFLIVAAALLAGLLFRLGVERRANEIGLLRATGFSAARVRRRFLAEGLVLAALGTLLGLAGGAAYAAALLAGLRSWWLPAIGEPVLFLHLTVPTLAVGAASSLLVVTLAIAGALRRLGKASIVGLLLGAIRVGSPSRSRLPLILALAQAALAVAIGLSAVAAAAGARGTAAGLALGAGAAGLMSGLAFYSYLAGRRRKAPQHLLTGGNLAMAARNGGRNMARSLLCVTLMACATFVIVLVAANRLHGEIDVTDRFSGAGGFTLVAETDVPLYGELAAESTAVAETLDATVVMPFRLRPGEDVSCLNLYQPERPRLLGVPPAMVARGGFDFTQTTAPTTNGWQLLDQELEPGVIPALGDYNSVLWILHSGLGKEIALTNERGEEIRLRLVGLLGKSVFQSELLISEADFERHFPSATGYSYFLLDPPPASSTQVATALERELARYGFDAVSTNERLASFQAVESTYLATFQTLGGLGLVLGTLGMGVILLRNVLERQAELATLRALGFTRRRLRTLVLLENALLLVVGLTVGSLAGIAAAAPTLIATGEGLPWVALGLILLAVLAIGMAASAFAVRSVARLPLVASLRAR